MKRNIMVSVFILLATLGYSQDDEKDLLRIRGWFKEINANMSQYRKVEFPDINAYKDLNPDHYSMEGAGIYRLGKIDMVQFLEGARLVKMVLTFHGDREDLTSEYYIRNGKLFFVDKVKTIYHQPKWDTEFKESERSVLKNRFYFKNNQLIKWVEWVNAELKNIENEDPSYKEYELNILNDYNLYRELVSGNG